MNEDTLSTVTLGSGGGSGVWSGMSIKDILEKVDLFNITTLDDDDVDTKKDIVKQCETAEPKKVVVSASRPESAFLGPKIWKNPITLPMLNSVNDDDTAEAEFSVMNIDDFLNENNFDLDRISPPLPNEEFLGRSSKSLEQQVMSPTSYASDDSMDIACQSDSGTSSKGRNLLPKGENTFLYAESKRAKIERERAERKRKLQVQVEFAQEDLALATIPGADFDPKRRHFSPDELRPQPIIRKRKKNYVSYEEKDDKYWERREKNNVAARRSREARRLKENQIALRTAYLEKENGALQVALDKSNEKNLKLEMENKRLREALEIYETGMMSMN